MAVSSSIPTHQAPSCSNPTDFTARFGTQCIKFGQKCFNVSFDRNGKAVSANRVNSNWYVYPIADFFGSEFRRFSSADVLTFLNNKDTQKTHVRKEIAELSRNHRMTTFPVYDALTLSGGGARGLSLTGIFRQLGDERLRNIKEVSGSSIGALAVLPIACGMKSHEVSEHILDSDPQLNENSILEVAQGAITKPLGKYTSQIMEFLHDQGVPLKNKEGKEIVDSSSPTALNLLTFRQLSLLRTRTSLNYLPEVHALKLKRLVVIATEINRGRKEEIELSENNSPDLPIVTAIRASCGYPFKIGSIKVKSSLIGKHKTKFRNTNEFNYITLGDGGISNNTPHIYIKGDNKLVVAFNTAEDRISRARLSLVEWLQQRVLSVPVYRYELFDITDAKKDPKVNLFFVRTDVKTLELEKAKVDFSFNELDVMRQFKNFEEQLLESSTLFESDKIQLLPVTNARQSPIKKSSSFSASITTASSESVTGDNSDIDEAVTNPNCSNENHSGEQQPHSYLLSRLRSLDVVNEEQSPSSTRLQAPTTIKSKKYHSRVGSSVSNKLSWFHKERGVTRSQSFENKRVSKSNTYTEGLSSAALYTPSSIEALHKSRSVDDYRKLKYSPSGSSFSINSETRKNKTKTKSTDSL